MKIFNFLIIILLISSSSYCQTDSLILFHPIKEGFNGKIFTLKTDSIEVEGIFVGEKSENKPIILFIQGSEPVPLYCSVGDTIFYPLIPWQLLEKTERFNFVFLSKPGIPALTDINKLDKKYYYLDEATGNASLKYLKNNNLTFYHHVYSALIKQLQSITDYSELIVMGHSQGSRIVAELSTNPLVDKIIYMSAEPLGRIAIQYDKEYSKFRERNNEKLSFYNSFFDPNKADSLYCGDTYKSWKSFTKPTIISLAKSNLPILIVYGEMDENCPNCYVFSFMQNYFNNMSVINYKELDHNFFNMERKNNWNIVIEDVCKWIENN